MKTRWIVPALGCVWVLLLSGPASAAVATYTYNFDRGDEGWVDGTGPATYDNWTGTNGRMQMLPVDALSTNMSGWTLYASTTSPYTTVGTVTRVNDANFSFSIPADATGLELQYSARQAYTGSGRYTRRLFGLGNAASPYRVRFGEWSTTGTPYYYINTNSSAQGITNALRENKLVVDFTANSGAGSATAYYDDYLGGGWQLVKAGWENVALGLTSGEWAAWNRLYLEMNGSVRIDNLTIRVTTPGAPVGDLTIKKFFDCDNNGVKNYVDDNLLAGWEYHITGPGGYDQTLTTDGAGQIALTGLPAGDYTVTETVKKDHTITTGNQGVVITIADGDNKTEMFGNILPGDINQDGLVDSVDFTILKANFGLTPKTWVEGNLNPVEDNLVDSIDFTILKAYFGQGVPPAPGAVPEPASAALLIVALAGMVLRRRAVS